MNAMGLSAKLKAAAVHVLTALGAVCGVMALLATISRQFEVAFLWLGLAFFIDGIDGIFARRLNVKTVLPQISGETIDLCVDYVTYVFVPAMMLFLSGTLTGVWGQMLVALICVSSLYHFADEGSKAADHCFVGFPAIWNIVAFFIFALQPAAWMTQALILACVALTFVPLKWVHPMRVTSVREITVAATVLWGLAAAWVAWSGFPAGPISGTILVAVALYGCVLSWRFGRAR
jgi:phosphatidylcholine synthase